MLVGGIKEETTHYIPVLSGEEMEFKALPGVPGSPSRAGFGLRQEKGFGVWAISADFWIDRGSASGAGKQSVMEECRKGKLRHWCLQIRN